MYAKTHSDNDNKIMKQSKPVYLYIEPTYSYIENRPNLGYGTAGAGILIKNEPSVYKLVYRGIPDYAAARVTILESIYPELIGIETLLEDHSFNTAIAQDEVRIINSTLEIESKMCFRMKGILKLMKT